MERKRSREDTPLPAQHIQYNAMEDDFDRPVTPDPLDVIQTSMSISQIRSIVTAHVFKHRNRLVYENPFRSSEIHILTRINELIAERVSLDREKRQNSTHEFKRVRLENDFQQYTGLFYSFLERNDFDQLISLLLEVTPCFLDATSFVGVIQRLVDFYNDHQ